MTESGDEYVARLRAAVGHAPLWLASVTGVVFDPERARTLLVTREQTGLWAPVAAVLGPGEEPAVAVRRAVLDATTVTATVDRLAWVHVTRELTYANGDRAQYLNLVFALTATGEHGEGARWVSLDSLPADMAPDHRERIMAALADGPTRWES